MQKKSRTPSKRHIRVLRTVLFLCAVCLVTATFYTFDGLIPDRITLQNDQADTLPNYRFVSYTLSDHPLPKTEPAAHEGALTPTYLRGSYTAEYRLLGYIPLKQVTVDVYDRLQLYPGGVPFGVRFLTDGVLIVGFCDVPVKNGIPGLSGSGAENPAYEAGLRKNDRITAVNGEALSGAADLTARIEQSEGKPLHLTYSRGGSEYQTDLIPVRSKEDGKYKTGLYIRDSGAGIGTVTFVCPESGTFAGLGHGICDADTGSLLPIHQGEVQDVTISGINRGQPGAPGEVKGYFGTARTGRLFGNTDCGVWGRYDAMPALPFDKPIPVGTRDEVVSGEAEIWCTLDESGPHSYTVQISAIDRSAQSGKCFTVTVTDPALLEKTGGIVQGMSGSPILQNGKLIGAVTHVLVGDPSTGYGIYLENMLSAMPGILEDAPTGEVAFDTIQAA